MTRAARASLAALLLLAACSDDGPAALVADSGAPGADAAADVPGDLAAPDDAAPDDAAPDAPPAAPLCKSDADCLAALGLGEPCRLPRCDEAASTCVLVARPDGAPCEDGDPCTVGSTCAGGACGGGAPRTCDDGDPCTVEACVAGVGCVAEPAPGCVAEVCGDGACAAGETCAACPEDCGACPAGPCCEAHGAPGCADAAVAGCVCAFDPVCCEDGWDAICVSEARVVCDAGCPVDATGCGDGACGPGEGCAACPADCGWCPGSGSCCAPNGSPGCDAPVVEACVCAEDAYCCLVDWDGTCVEEALAACGAGCGADAVVCGDGACAAAEACETCPEDCGSCPGAGDCCLPSDAPGCGDAAVQACVCGADAFCCESAWDDLCADAAPACGASCEVVATACGDGVCDLDEGCAACPADCGTCPGGDGCACGWDTAGCGPLTARLAVVPLDIWAQPLPEVAVTLTAPGGTALAEEDTLCGPVTLTLTVEAPHHDALVASLAWDGSGGPEGLTVTPDPQGPPAAFALHTALAGEGQAQVRTFTLVAGLPHRWLAPTGRPARRGNAVTVLHGGEEAWATAWVDLQLATQQVLASTWWWTSEVELVRDPALHPWLPEDERWAHTAMGVLESLAGVDVKVLVNQFYSQDGLLSSVTIDGELTAKAKAPGDGFEFMGQANEVHGAFTVVPAGVDFAARVAKALPALAEAELVDDAPLPPFAPPIAVDASALPLGLSLLEIPIASWHQKFLAIDQGVAYVGGMNIKTTDWDTRQHRVFEERRMAFDASVKARLAVKAKEAEPDFAPRKDYLVRIEGPSAIDAVDVFGRRWQAQLAAGALYADLSTPLAVGAPPAPKAGGVQVQIAQTAPPPKGELSILDGLLRALDQAEQYVLIEDQYFRAPLLVDRLVERMLARPELVLLVVTNPVNEWVDPACWQTHLASETLAGLFPDRFRTWRVQSFDYAVDDCLFCIDETDATFTPHSLHSKLVLIDDLFLSIGSSNSNNRGLLYEGELQAFVFDGDVARDTRLEVIEDLLGEPGPGDPALLLPALDAAAAWNQGVYDAWDDEGMDLDLDGDPVPAAFLPRGLLYPLAFGSPGDCFLENVGPDVM